MITRVESHSVLVYWNTWQNIIDKINSLETCADYPVTISPGAMPNKTTTQNCSRIHFYS